MGRQKTWRSHRRWHDALYLAELERGASERCNWLAAITLAILFDNGVAASAKAKQPDVWHVLLFVV